MVRGYVNLRKTRREEVELKPTRALIGILTVLWVVSPVLPALAQYDSPETESNTANGDLYDPSHYKAGNPTGEDAGGDGSSSGSSS
ncbi:MAG: hypothetical protein ACLFUM_11570, partial [Spirochaetaceae bacterium]